MNDKPFMPKATAVWLVENTKISFKQIADFCNLHELEVKGIAEKFDDEVVMFCAKIEAEIAELDEDEKEMFLEE